jgi:4-hydroxyacetophenone monooxygenase
MLPVAPPMSARPILVDPNRSVYDALLRDDVSLVTDGIRRITRDGIEASDGSTYEVDVIVLATGFKSNDFIFPMEIRGRGGQRVEELWSKDGARAYLGSMLPGFPNFFMIYGPNTNPYGGLQVVDMEEVETRFALGCIGHLITENKRYPAPSRPPSGPAAQRVSGTGPPRSRSRGCGTVAPPTRGDG